MLKNVIGVGALLVGVMIAANAVSARGGGDESYRSRQCAPLCQTSTGREIAAPVCAHIYSKENVGAVGIPIAAGRDLGSTSPHELGALLVEGLRRQDVKAECFVDNEPAPQGTGVEFVICGLEWDKHGSLSVSEALNVETLKAVAAEATVTRLLVKDCK